jgi:hypothetical protein
MGYFLKPLTDLEAFGAGVGLESLVQAPKPKATATRVRREMDFIIGLSCMPKGQAVCLGKGSW